MTETTCAALHVPRGVLDDNGSVGYLDPDTEAKLVDDDGREATEAWMPEELYVRGLQMCMGYWRNEKAAAETLGGERWLRTGDVAKVDERSWVWIVDRKKARRGFGHFLKRGSRFVWPAFHPVSGIAPVFRGVDFELQCLPSEH